MHKISWLSRTFWHIEGILTLFSPLSDLKFLTEKRDTPNMHKFSRYHKFSETLQGCSWSFSALWDQNFSTEWCDTLFFFLKPFRNEKFSQKQLNSITKIFGTVRQKTFDRKKWHTLLCMKLFDIPNFLKHWRDVQELFQHCETKKVLRKTATPLLCIKFFDYPKFSENLKGCPRVFSALSDLKLFDGKSWYTLFIRKNFSKPESFSKTVGFLYKRFRHCETKIFRWKVVTTLLCIKFFDCPKHSETLKGYLRFFRQCQTWSFRQKNVIPLICINFPDTKFFLKHSRVAHEIFRHWETIFFRRKNEIHPPL